MCNFFSLMLSGDAIRWWNAWTGIWAVWTIITVYFWFQSINNKANKLILDRFVNENIETDVLEHITFIKNYETYIWWIKHTIPKWIKTNIYVKKNTEEITHYTVGKENSHRTTKSIYWDWSIFVTYPSDEKDILISSERFDHKIFTIRNLAKYTNVNEIYWIFKKQDNF